MPLLRCSFQHGVPCCLAPVDGVDEVRVVHHISGLRWCEQNTPGAGVDPGSMSGNIIYIYTYVCIYIYIYDIC